MKRAMLENEPFVREIRMNPKLLTLGQYRAGTDVERCINISQQILIKGRTADDVGREYDLSSRRVRKLVADHVQRCKSAFIDHFLLT